MGACLCLPLENISEKKQLDLVMLELLQDLQLYFSTAASLDGNKMEALSKRQRDIIQMQKVGVKIAKWKTADHGARLGEQNAIVVTQWMEALGDSFKALDQHAEDFKQEVAEKLEERLKVVIANAKKVFQGGLNEGSSWHSGLSDNPTVGELLAAGIAAKFTETARSKKLTADFKELCQDCSGVSVKTVKLCKRDLVKDVSSPPKAKKITSSALDSGRPQICKRGIWLRTKDRKMQR